MSERLEVLRELAELEESAERLSEAIAAAEARAEAARQRANRAEPAFTELGGMVLEVQRQLDELEETYRSHRDAIGEATESEARKILAEAETRAREIRSAMQYLAGVGAEGAGRFGGDPA